MRAMVLTQPRAVSESPLQLETARPLPEPGVRQVRLRVTACGVCHTDLHTVIGELSLPQLPIVPGHQIVGSVDKLGAEVTRLQIGDRVGVAWLHAACGECEHCQRGNENLCQQARFTGLHTDGGYAEYAIANADFAFHLPPQFSDYEAAPLLCAGIIGYRSLRLSGIAPGGRLGLYGFGASAHLAIQVARHWNCEVCVFTRSQEHRALAMQLGAAWAGGAEEQPPALLDAGITFAPVGSLIPRALSHLRPGGTLAINAIHLSPIPELHYHLIYEERVLRSVANFTRRDATEFLQLAAAIPVRTAIEVFPLHEANRALQELERSEIHGAAVLAVTEEE